MKTKPAWLASLLATLLFLAPAIPAVGSTNSCGFTGLEMTNGICTDCTWHAIKADGSTWGASCQSNRWNLGQLRSTSIDLDDYVGCDDDAELDWISDGSFTDDLESGTKAKLVFDAANYNIKLEATCDGGDATRLRLLNCIALERNQWGGAWGSSSTRRTCRTADLIC